MPMFRVNVKTTQKGAIFKASATRAAAERMVTSINELLAQEGVSRILARLRVVLQHPTGFYQSRIVVTRGQTYRGVSDSAVAYGGWLEGISRRNQTTRFKGYHTFTDIMKSLAQDKEALATPAVKQFINELS